MKRRLALRDRAVWLIAAVAVAAVVYLILPIWVLLVAILLLIGVPFVVRHRRAQHARR
jgi:hypothetical protein